MSCPDRKWRVYWSDIDRTCDHLRAGLTYFAPKDRALTEKAMEKLNEDTVELESNVELKGFVSVTIKARNILNEKNDNARKLIAAAAAAARIEFNRVTDALATSPPTLATADAASALISLASVGTHTLNMEMPAPFPVVTDNIDEQEPSLANVDTNDTNTELPIVHTTPNIHEEEQEPQFLNADM